MTLVQGSPDWLAWRMDGVGASDSPAIMGHSPYATAAEVLHEKVHRVAPVRSGFVLRRGHQVERALRMVYERQMGFDFPAATYEHAEFSYLRASLDGFNPQQGLGIEIKYVGSKAFATGDIPLHHLLQVQHQMLVTGCARWTLLYSPDGVNFKAFPIKADKRLQADILRAASRFWADVTAKRLALANLIPASASYAHA
jgi:putative phage-type endonuclease